MSEKDINNLKEMLIDFNEYSTDYTKTRCRELEETIDNTLKEIERLNENNQAMQEEMARTWKKVDEKENIIKEVREYVEKHSQMTNLQINGIENVLSFRGSVEELLGILNKEVN